jgi:hypothetical protein
LETDLGDADTNHAGGITVYGNRVYLTSRESVAVYSLEAVMSEPSESSVKPVGKFPLFFEAAFVHAEDDLLYVGEFYREENYPTAESHHILTPSGETNTAVIAVYELNRDSEFGFADTVPARIYSIPGLAQGMCLTSDGKIYLSASYGMADSHIYIYANPISTESRDKFLVETAEIPLYFLDNGNIEKTISVFPMSEEIAYVDEQIYVMCESASNKYIFGKLTGNNKLFSFSEK